MTFPREGIQHGDVVAEYSSELEEFKGEKGVIACLITISNATEEKQDFTGNEGKLLGEGKKNCPILNMNPIMPRLDLVSQITRYKI